MNYDRTATLYDALAQAYSWGAIHRAKCHHLKHVRPGESVLYAGGGSCAEGVLAAQLGARVTVVDSSQEMLKRAAARFRRTGKRVQLLRGDALARGESYDHVVAPFFLNVFGDDEVAEGLARLGERVSAGGMLTVVDFRAPSGAAPFRLLQRIHYLPPLVLFALWTGTPWHPLYDYPALFSESRLQGTLVERQCSRVLGLPLYESISWCLP